MSSAPSLVEPRPRTVILWVHPRSTSTMFECCMLNKQDEFRVLHEPMGDAFYFGPERISNRYTPERCDEEYPQFKDSTFAKVWGNMVDATTEGPSRTFSKDMAQYIFNQARSTNVTSVPSLTSEGGDNDNSSLIPTALLTDPTVHHTFLIRHPSKAVPPYARLCYPGSETGFDYFDTEEAGYRELRMLFDVVREANRRQRRPAPLLIESEELLKNPKDVMRLWCDDCGIDFDEDMLTWNEGTREHFAKWPGFHTSAEQSKGVGQVSHRNVEPVKEENVEKVDQCIQQAMADYEYLRGFAKGPSV